MNLAPVTEGLNLPSDLAFASDGSIFVAERGGAVRLIRDGVLVDTPALDLSPEITRKEGGLLAVALDPNFGKNGLAYALYAVDAPRNGLEFTLARFRYLDGVFRERAVLLDRTEASVTGASGALRVGPDGKLYVALDSASDGRIAASFATYNGKVLRINTDATTPDDQPGSNPIYSLEHPQPLALDWQPATGTLWVVDRVGTDAGRLSAVVKNAGQSRAALRTAYALPAGTGAASAAFYRGDLMPIFKGNLFIAAEMGRQLMRLRFDPDNASKIVSVERMLTDEIGAVRVVSEGPDGALYIATECVVPAGALIRRSRLVAAYIAGAIAIGGAQQVPPDAGTTFRSGVDVVRLDVSVLDQNRLPIRGLTQRISPFWKTEWRNLSLRLTPSTCPISGARASWMRDVAPDVATNRFNAQRVVVILLDDFGVPFDPSAVQFSKNIARAAIDQLGPLILPQLSTH